MHREREVGGESSSDQRFGLLPNHFHLQPLPVDGSVTLDRLRRSSAVATLVDAMCTGLGTGNRQVGTSILVQRLAAALTAPTLASTLLFDALPTVEVGQISIAVVGAAPSIAFASSAALHLDVVGDRAALLSAWHGHWLNKVFRFIIDAIRHVEPCAVRTLWGNVVAATVENVATLDWWYPDHQIKALGSGLYASEGLYRRHARLDDHTFGGRVGMLCTRNTCCLLTRVEPSGPCVNCPNLTAEERIQSVDCFLTLHRPSGAL